MNIVIVGHVDHGKSTLIGRLFHDTGNLPEGRYEQLAEVARRRGVPFEFANLTDGLQAERDQNITIEIAQIWFRTPRRTYVLIDAPGHKEFLKNMVTGAASADAALLLVDAASGVREQTRRHAYLLKLLGLRQVTVVVNKMDLCGFSEVAYERVRQECAALLSELGLGARHYVPISAREGDLVAARGERMPWYAGPTVAEALDEFTAPEPPVSRPLRFALQDVYRFDDRRILAGRVESGTLRVGDRLVFLPGGKSATVASLERWGAPRTEEAVAGESVGLMVADPIFVERGQIAVRAGEGAGPAVTRELAASVFWMGRQPMVRGRRYVLKLLTQEVECEVLEVRRVIDAATLAGGQRDEVGRYEVAELVLRLRAEVAADLHHDLAGSGRFVIADGLELAGGGTISGLAAGAAEARDEAEGPVRREERAARNGHPGRVVYVVGADATQRARAAGALDRALFHRGAQAFLVGEGRPVGEIALLAEAGLLAIVPAAHAPRGRPDVTVLPAALPASAAVEAVLAQDRPEQAACG